MPDPDGLKSVQAYRVGERRDMISRAQKSRRHDEVTDRLEIVEVLRGTRRRQRIRVNEGRMVDVTMMTSRERRHLFIAGRTGWSLLADRIRRT
jgi:hypothetical protein